MAEQLALQLGSGGSNPTPSLQYIIEPIGHDAAKLFIERWHYSGKMPTGKNINYGLRRNGSLYAVIVYGIGVNPFQASFLGVKHVVEIKRLVRREPKESYSLSRFINLTTRMLTRMNKIDAIVAFADPQYGHEGTVYKAAGFSYAGKTLPEWHTMDKDNIIRHRRYAYRAAKRWNIKLSEAREKLGLTRIKTQPKHRWVRHLR